MVPGPARRCSRGDRGEPADATTHRLGGLGRWCPVRIAIGGKGWLAVRAARLLGSLAYMRAVDGSIEVVRNRDDTGQDSWLPSLVAVAISRGWKIHSRAEEAGLGSGDVFLSLQHDRIVDCAALDARAYNLHFARVPQYRGSLTSVWPIRNGDTVAGVTLHVLTQAVDAGPVIASALFEIPTFFTAYDLYRAYHAHGFELLAGHLEDLLGARYEAVPQDDAAAAVYLRNSVDFSDVALRDFDRSAEQVRDHCRSLIFPPAQFPIFRGQPVQACSAVYWSGAPDVAPGTVLAEDTAQAVVACRSGLICLEYVS
jgi:methionyl-tRNA formyltransferase